MMMMMMVMDLLSLLLLLSVVVVPVAIFPDDGRTLQTDFVAPAETLPNILQLRRP
jgi:hypothetical protein